MSEARGVMRTRITLMLGFLFFVFLPFCPHGKMVLDAPIFNHERCLMACRQYGSRLEYQYLARSGRLR